jgi:DNA (cytosine-5)-methyltransferase 1
VEALCKRIIHLARETNREDSASWFEAIGNFADKLAPSAKDLDSLIPALSHFLNIDQNPVALTAAFGSDRTAAIARRIEDFDVVRPAPIELDSYETSGGVDPPRFTFMDLFAGIGGFHLALSSVGGQCVFASEIDAAARTTYAMNFGLVPYGDIRRFTRTKAGSARSASNIKKLVPYADVIAAGFPCQPFSLAGVSSRNFHGLEHGLRCEAQGTLFEDILILAKALAPKALLLENVRNLASHDGGNTLRVIRKEIEKAGYTIYPRWTPGDKNWAIIDSNAVVGQTRKRVYMIAIRNDLCHTRGLRNEANFVLPKFDVIPGRHTLKHVIDMDKMSPQEKFRLYGISEKLYRSHLARDRKHRARNNGFETRIMFDLDRPSPTLVARYFKDGKDCLIPRRDPRDRDRPPRMLTPTECALLQTYPANFWIYPRKSVAYKQFGNSITVEIARQIADKLAAFLQ